jgi:hypothetical protein
MNFFEWELFHDKGRNLTFYKIIWSILLAMTHDDIYWKGALPQ